jgi:hypothetical protein
MSPEERLKLIERFDAGPRHFRAALLKLPPAALQWRPGPGKWSAHEIVCHCADSETVSGTRIRYLVGQDRPAIQGYDQDQWAVRFDYHSLPIEGALKQIEQVRAWTGDFVRRLPESAWTREGTHTESGRYTAETWLRTYAEHLEIHARQLDRNLAAWMARKT